MIEKKHIIEKATLQFKNYGLRCITMDDIAKELGISKKTLYQFIEDKNALINAVIDQEYNKTRNIVEKISLESTNSIEELIRINSFIIKYLQTINPTSIADLKKHYQSVYIESSNRFRELFSQTILASIKQGKASKIFRDDINEDIITNLHTERVDSMQESAVFSEKNAAAPELIKEMITYYLRGLVTKQGEILLDNYLLNFEKFLNTSYTS